MGKNKVCPCGPIPVDGIFSIPLGCLFIICIKKQILHMKHTTGTEKLMRNALFQVPT